MIDIRNLIVNYKEQEVDPSFEAADSKIVYNITISTNSGKLIGTMDFSAYTNVKKGKNIHDSNLSLPRIIDKIIYIEDVWVMDGYRNLGIGQLLYKKFGEIYNDAYSDWPVGRYYVNALAEYAFRKAVGLGWIHENALNDNYVSRDIYYDKNPNKPNWSDLNEKLPDSVKTDKRFYW